MFILEPLENGPIQLSPAAENGTLIGSSETDWDVLSFVVFHNFTIFKVKRSKKTMSIYTHLKGI